MKEKKPRSGICQDCVETFPIKKINDFLIENKFGPEHYINLCNPCKNKRTNAITINTPRKKTRPRISR